MLYERLCLIPDLNSDIIKIKESLFNDPIYASINEYKISLLVTIPGSPDITGTTETILTVNRPPTSGTCSISPSIGEEVNTEFSIACSGWTDTQGIQQYTFYSTLFDFLLLIITIYFHPTILFKFIMVCLSYSDEFPAESNPKVSNW